ncbi:deazaflavin-dependent oxidoreductase (nitroreductase family) [Actinocorallia herbida]|uniref:Deazaflavin-dependent oxidoreductase (Nitroreductase family) n=1 Tax=Actinocorallia herbida TaxID=58109 RepID=A0A3N1D2Y8_9ACTN|nr:nitroreductase/quinone reductase family protein [Actinocorallia herbida]ROO87428.1 deazaflavin-dependent oxidoreductase (nitroreductase family) [Actinocorallia herbida]
MAARDAVPHVDPRVPRGVLYRVYVRLLGGRAARWLFARRGMWKADVALMRLTRNRLGLGLLLPTGLLQTRGARTGAVRRNTVIYFHDGDRITVVASFAGAPTDPAWCHNARAHPGVLFNGLPFRAQVVRDEAARERLWELADQVFPVYAVYREQAARAGRAIPILQLTPTDPRAAPD